VLSVEGSVQQALLSLGTEIAVPVAGSVALRTSPVLSALWKSHRLRGLAEGDLVLAAFAARLLVALEGSPEGAVALAAVGAPGAELLALVDRRGGLLLAVCPNARSYLAATGLSLC
jgi:hypothetical protein